MQKLERGDTMPIMSKILGRVIIESIKNVSQRCPQVEQVGCRKNKSTVE